MKHVNNFDIFSKSEIVTDELIGSPSSCKMFQKSSVIAIYVHQIWLGARGSAMSSGCATIFPNPLSNWTVNLIYKY